MGNLQIGILTMTKIYFSKYLNRGLLLLKKYFNHFSKNVPENKNRRL